MHILLHSWKSGRQVAEYVEEIPTLCAQHVIQEVTHIFLPTSLHFAPLQSTRLLLSFVRLSCTSLLRQYCSNCIPPKVSQEGFGMYSFPLLWKLSTIFYYYPPVFAYNNNREKKLPHVKESLENQLGIYSFVFVYFRKKNVKQGRQLTVTCSIIFYTYAFYKENVKLK